MTDSFPGLLEEASKTIGDVGVFVLLYDRFLSDIVQRAVRVIFFDLPSKVAVKVLLYHIILLLQLFLIIQKTPGKSLQPAEGYHLIAVQPVHVVSPRKAHLVLVTKLLNRRRKLLIILSLLTSCCSS